MQTEIEVKFTQINLDDMRTKLKSLGAELVYPERLMRRINFTGPEGQRSWIRVRDEGDKVTMSYKQTLERSLHGTKEINLVVDNFENAKLFLATLGYKQKAYQETKRELWKLNDCDVTLDSWPWIPSFVEIEGTSEEEVKKVVEGLHCDWSKAHYGSVETAYQEFYDITEEEMGYWPEVTFTPVPEWLEGKRK